MSTGGSATRPSAASIDAATTFRVLGPLEVSVGASLLEVGGRQERALLALLLTAPGRVFSIPAIVAGLWGERPPRRADHTVMSYVSRLRRGLPDGVATSVVTRRPGYLVSIEPDQVDAERFRSLVGKGHRELAAGRPELAADSLREALGLWRGDAYAEFDAPFAVAERSALEELRLAALEDRVSAELDIGEAPDLVAELEALVSAHPLRERLWAQLMTALYRSGRQADALRSYQRARSSLVDELGVEPGDELQNRHALVLAHDPRLLGPGTDQVTTWRAARAGDSSAAPASWSCSTRPTTGPRRAPPCGCSSPVPTGWARRDSWPRSRGTSRRPAGPSSTNRSGRGRLQRRAELLVLDDLQRWSVADLVRISEVLTRRSAPGTGRGGLRLGRPLPRAGRRRRRPLPRPAPAGAVGRDGGRRAGRALRAPA